MKAKKLIKILEKNPEWEVKTSVDISKGEKDSDRRAFGEEVVEVIEQGSNNEFMICFDGYDNHNIK